jgi:hypothetical protein
MDTTLLRYLLPAFARRRRDTLMRLFAIVLAVSMLIAGVYQNPATAKAAATCTDSLGNTIPCAPPPLLNSALLNQSGGLYEATAAQQQSLANLEQQATQATINDHQLASSDGTAVQSWGRDDAEAELWTVLTQAISPTKTMVSSTGVTSVVTTTRTTDQQNAVDWLTAMQLRMDVQSSDDAGLE